MEEAAYKKKKSSSGIKGRARRTSADMPRRERASRTRLQVAQRQCERFFVRRVSLPSYVRRSRGRENVRALLLLVVHRLAPRWLSPPHSLTYSAYPLLARLASFFSCGHCGLEPPAVSTYAPSSPSAVVWRSCVVVSPLPPELDNEGSLSPRLHPNVP